jgi:hypothetical protein
MGSIDPPVNQADVRTMSIVRATMLWLGPFCRLPVRLSTHIKGGRTTKTSNRVQPMQQSSAQRAVRPLLLLTKATQRARRIQPTTSLPIPAAKVVTPTLERSKLSSLRIRQSTGKAVMASAVPMNRPKTPKPMGWSVTPTRNSL